MNRGKLFLSMFLLAMMSLFTFAGCKEDPANDPEQKPVFEWMPIIGVFENGVLQVPLHGGHFEITYKLENPVEGAVPEVAADAAWISDLTIADGKVTFDVPETTASEIRDARITVNYPELVPAPEMIVRQVAGPKPSDNVIEIRIEETYTTSVDYHIATSNDDAYAMVTYTTASLDGKTDAEIIQRIKEDQNKSINFGDVFASVNDLDPDTAYTILCVGMEENIATTGLSRGNFRTLAEEQPSAVSISATFDKYYDMHAIAEIDPDFGFYTDFGDCFMPLYINVDPEDAMFWTGVFVNEEGLTDEVLLDQLMSRPPAQNKDDAPALWYNKEYIVVAVAQNADGDMSAIWRSEPFTLTAEGASPAQGFFDDYLGGGGDEAAVSISATFDEYYDMHAIAEIDPDFGFYTDFGDCFMPVYITVNPEDAMFWTGVFVNEEGLTDEVLLGELMNRPPAQSKDDAPALWYNKEYIVVAVAQNAEGEMSAIWRSEPFVLLKDYASPAQGFFDDYLGENPAGAPQLHIPFEL